MKRIRRMLSVFVLATGALALAVVVLYYTMRVEMARYVIEHGLRGAGISDAAFQIRAVSLDRIDLGEVEFRKPHWGSAASISATYTISSLLRGRIHALTIHNAHWKVDNEDSNEDSAGFDGFNVPLDVPLDQLNLQSVTIEVPQDGVAQQFVVNGAIQRVAANAFHADLGIVSDQQVVLRFGELEVVGVNVQARLLIRNGRRETVIAAREGNVIGVDRISLRTDASVHDAIPARFVLGQAEYEPLVRIGRSARSPFIRAAAELKSTTAMTISGPLGHTFIPALATMFQYEATRNRGPTTRIDVSIQNASMRSDDYRFAVVGLNALVPVDFNVPVARRGPISAEAIVWRGEQFDNFSGSLGAAEGYLDADIEGSLGGGAKMAVNAAFAFNGGLVGDVAAFIPPFQMSNADAIRQLIPELRDAHIGGTYAVDSQFLLRDGAIDPYIHVKATNAQLFSAQWPLAIDSADADVTFTSLAPVRTPPSQRITIHRARAGQIEVDGGEVAFQVQDWSNTTVEDLRWSMGPYGEFRASPFVMNLLEPNFESNVDATNVGLGAWLDLLTNGRATSDGTLSGTLALRIDATQSLPVQIVSGQLTAQPAMGNVEIEDARMLGRFLDRNTPSTLGSIAEDQWQEVRARMVSALSDFNYHTLQFDFLPQDGDVLCKIQAAGRGRSGPEPLEFGSLTINVGDFNQDILNEVLLFRGAFRRME